MRSASPLRRALERFERAPVRNPRNLAETSSGRRVDGAHPHACRWCVLEALALEGAEPPDELLNVASMFTRLRINHAEAVRRFREIVDREEAAHAP